MSGPFDERYYRKALYRERPNSPRNRRRLAEVVRLKPSGGRLLEVGCAEGGFLSLASAHFDVRGIDASEYAARAIRERFGLPAEAADIESAALPGGAFDVIVAFNVLEHLADPEAVVARLFDALKPGGVLIGSVPNAGGIVGRPAAFIGGRLDRSHRSVFPPLVWRRVFETAGFAPVRFFGELNFGRNRSVYLRRAAWRHLAIALVFVCEKW
jgi:2-polyprenyl-3-methyl-5-hydroxy-6-metoxy-1,4-benzoquinol methylase